MKINKEEQPNLQKTLVSIALGTLIGLGTYGFCLHFDIEILGWNLGLLFAPLAAGYSETYIAKKLVGKDVGATSALILFIVTVVYGFIIDNPTLGYNLITLASIIIILQAAAPTVTNYFGMVILLGIISKLIDFIKRLTDKGYTKLFKRAKKDNEIIDVIKIFNETESNELLNSQNFYYFTPNTINLEYENIGYFYATKVMDKNTAILGISSSEIKKKRLNDLKTGKDECLIKLANEIKSKNGNGVIDLEIEYFLTGFQASEFQIVAQGMGIRVKE